MGWTCFPSAKLLERRLAWARNACAAPKLAPSAAARVCVCVRIFVQEERNAVQLLDEEQRPQFVPTSYDALRRVGG